MTQVGADLFVGGAFLVVVGWLGSRYFSDHTDGTEYGNYYSQGVWLASRGMFVSGALLLPVGLVVFAMSFA